MNRRICRIATPLVAVLLAACSDNTGGHLSLAMSSVRPGAPVASAGVAAVSGAPAVIAAGDSTVIVLGNDTITLRSVEIVLREIELITLTPPIRAQYQIQSRQGALVNRVSDRVQQQIGLQSGDVIVQINRTPIANGEDVNRILTSYGRGGIRLYFERGGQIYATEFSLQ